MHSLVPFLITMGRSRLSIESVEVSPSCVCKGGSNLTVISFPGSELDSWACFGFGMVFSLEYTLGNCVPWFLAIGTLEIVLVLLPLIVST